MSVPANMTQLTSCPAKDAIRTSTQSVPDPVTMTKLTNCQAKDAISTSKQSASFQLQHPLENPPTVKPRMSQAHQIVSFIPAPATITELTLCQAKDIPSTSNQSASFQLHDMTYSLLSHGYHMHIRTVNIIPASATMTKLTSCHAKDATSTWTQSASFQLQPPLPNLLSVKPRMPQAYQHSQLHSSSSHHNKAYLLSNTVNFIPATMTALTSCQAKDTTSTSRLSTSFQLQPPFKNLPTVNPRMP
jgi:hypothetical protein